MFLTTEPTIIGRQYTILRIIHTCTYTDTVGYTKLGSPKAAPNQVDEAIEAALAQIAKLASQLQADGVVGIHHSISSEGLYTYITIMGTAVKF